jgi:hypothetical protein
MIIKILKRLDAKMYGDPIGNVLSENASNGMFMNRKYLININIEPDAYYIDLNIFLQVNVSGDFIIKRGRAFFKKGLVTETDEKKQYTILHSNSIIFKELVIEPSSISIAKVFQKPRFIQNFYYNKPILALKNDRLIFSGNSKAKPSPENIHQLLECMSLIADAIERKNGNEGV